SRTKLPTGPVRNRIALLVPISAVIFFVILALPVQSVPSTAQNTSSSLGNPAQPTVTPGTPATAKPTTLPSTTDSGKPGTGQFALQQLGAKLATVGGANYGGEVLTDLSIDSSQPPQHIFVLGPTNPPRHVRATRMPGVLAESLYISSPAQAAMLNKSSVRQA